MSGQRHAPAYLLPVPIKWDAVWAHSRSASSAEENCLVCFWNRIAIVFCFTARSLVTTDLARQYGDE